MKNKARQFGESGSLFAASRRFGLFLLSALVLSTLWLGGTLWIAHADSGKSVIVDGRSSEEIWINTAQGRFRFTAEIADEPHERQRGLMYREEMAADHGMLFVFDETRVVNMWMANTPMSLDMIFIDPDGKVVNIARRTVPFSRDIVSSGEPVAYVLEVKAGVASMIGLKPDDTLEHPVFNR